jgi:hypothetical protein
MNMRLDALCASVTKIAHNDIGFTEICCTLPNSRADLAGGVLRIEARLDEADKPSTRPLKSHRPSAGLGAAEKSYWAS